MKKQHKPKESVDEKIARALEGGELEVEPDEITEVLDLACARLASSTRETAKVIERTAPTSVRPPAHLGRT